MNASFTILLALFISTMSYAQTFTTSDFEEEGLAIYSIKETDNQLIINDSILITKGENIKINLPYSRKNFQFIKKKKSGFAQLAKQASEAVSSGALAVGLGSNSVGTVGGALQVIQKANAVYYGADALDKIDQLPISNEAKKIAAQEMKILKWEK